MGYTHYWSFKAIKGQARQNAVNYKRAVRACAKVARAWSKTNGGLSGYTAHTPVGQYDGVHINGKGEDAHEDFVLRQTFAQNGSNFCKTAQKPYDTVVVACLCILKHYLGDAFDVSSDGDAADWAFGLQVAQRVTGLKIALPNTIRHPFAQIGAQNGQKTVKI